MDVGRPSKYSEDFVDRAHQYLDTYKELGDVVPTIEGFAFYANLSKKTIYNWIENNVCSKDFLHAVEMISTLQARGLQNGGLKGEYNPTIAKLMLSANHGMVERKDITTDGDKIQSVNININEPRPSSDNSIQQELQEQEEDKG